MPSGTGEVRRPAGIDRSFLFPSCLHRQKLNSRRAFMQCCIEFLLLCHGAIETVLPIHCVGTILTIQSLRPTILRVSTRPPGRAGRLAPISWRFRPFVGSPRLGHVSRAHLSSAIFQSSSINGRLSSRTKRTKITVDH